MSVRFLPVLPAVSALLSCQLAPNLEVRQNFSYSLHELVDRSAVVLVGTPVSRIRLTVEYAMKGMCLRAVQ